MGTVVGQQHCRRQVFRICVDGKTEQHELDQRHADHHAECHPITTHLNEFLHDNGPETG